jgi:hypothetical protein
MSLAAVRDAPFEPTHRLVDVRATVEELRRSHPRAGEEGLAGMLADRFEEDRHLLLDASLVLVRQFLGTAKNRERQRRAASAPVRAARRVADRAEVQVLAARE